MLKRLKTLVEQHSYECKNKICIITYIRLGQPRSEKALLALQALSEKFSGQSLVFLAITKDADSERAEKIKETLNLSFPVLFDEDGILYKDLGAFVFWFHSGL